MSACTSFPPSRIPVVMPLLAVLYAACVDGEDGGSGDHEPFGPSTIDKELDTAETASLVDILPVAVRDKMMAQVPLKEAASQIRWAVERGDDIGFAGISLEETAVVLYWKGILSDSMRNVIEGARDVAPVEVRDAPYALAELKAEAEQLTTMMRANPGSSMHSISIPVDGSELVVGTDTSTAPVPTSLPTLRVPLRMVPQVRMEFASRLADTPAYYGGARLVNMDNGLGCSSGFGVIDGVGVRYLLTAGHCGRPGGGWWNGNRSRVIGTAMAERVDHDLLLIPTQAGNRIFDGGVGVGEFSKGVAGWDWVYAHEYLCLSPSVTGVICGAHATTDFTFTLCNYDAYRNWECYSDLILATNGDWPSPRPCVSGDSGGPVFSLASNNRVTAKGTITSCGPSGFSFQDFGTAWRDFGISPLVSY